jgi:hypothetical protein
MKNLNPLARIVKIMAAMMIWKANCMRLKITDDKGAEDY